MEACTILPTVSAARAEAALAAELGGAPHVTQVLAGFAKTAVRLADGRIARFPRTAEAAAELVVEQRLLARLAGRTTLRVPAIEYVGKRVAFDLYREIPGEPLTHAAFLALAPEQRRHIGAQLGQFLAEVHAVVPVAAAVADGALPSRWPLPHEVLLTRLQAQMLPAPLWRFVERAARAHAALATPETLRRTLHNDLGGHNLACDLMVGTVVGVFDFGDAEVADLHQDFQYLPAYDLKFAEAAADSYGARTGEAPDLGRIAVRHIYNTLSHVAFAAEAPAARAFAEKLGWIVQTRERYEGYLPVTTS